MVATKRTKYKLKTRTAKQRKEKNPVMIIVTSILEYEHNFTGISTWIGSYPFQYTKKICGRTGENLHIFHKYLNTGRRYGNTRKKSFTYVAVMPT